MAIFDITNFFAGPLKSVVSRIHSVVRGPFMRYMDFTRQVVARTKTPTEIREEYERLAQEREERRLNQRTNPRVSVILTKFSQKSSENPIDTISEFSPIIVSDAFSENLSLVHDGYENISKRKHHKN